MQMEAYTGKVLSTHVCECTHECVCVDTARKAIVDAEKFSPENNLVRS